MMDGFQRVEGAALDDTGQRDTGDGGAAGAHRVPDVSPPPEAREAMLNVPGSVLFLLAALLLVHLVRVLLLTPDEDMHLIIMASFIPARYAEGLVASGLIGFISPVTYNFLHGDWTHLIVNSVWLLAMGSAVAKRVGSVRFLAFSLICGVFAALAHLIAHFGEVTPMIGASGAISGHMAAALRFIFSVDSNRQGGRLIHDDLRAVPLKPLVDALRDPRVLLVLGVWLATNVVSGAGILPVTDEDTAIAWEAHIGGLVAGLLLFGLFDHPDGEVARQPSRGSE